MSPSLMQILVVVLIGVLLFGHHRAGRFGKDLGAGLRAFFHGLNGPTSGEHESADAPRTRNTKGRRR